MRLKPPKHSAAFFALLLLIVSILAISTVKPAYSVGPPSYAGSGTGTTSLSVPNVLPGDIVFVWEVAASVSGFNGWHITSSLSSSNTPFFFGCNQAGPLNGGFNCAVYLVEGGTGTDTVTVHCTPDPGCSWTGTSYFDHWQNVASISTLLYQKNCGNGANCPANSGTDSQTLSPISNSANVMEQIEQISCGGTCTCPNPTVSAANSQIVVTATACAGASNTVGSWRAAVPADGMTHTYGFSYSGASSAANGDNGIIIMYGGAPSNLGGLVQCYGNCGNPPVTLANTNSTHTVNFNQTVTLLYPFQSNLNGYIVNMTTSLAKTYSTFQILYIGLWTTSSCPINSQPFTTACPGLKVASLNSGTFPSKGLFSLSFASGQIPAAAGQWFAVGVSGLYSGLDLNDTNTGVAVSQTNGVLPPTLTAISTFNPSFKMGLWAFIIGNTAGSAPPSTSTSCASNPQLDCILTNAVNSFCSVVTAACQTSSALLWLVILAAITFFSLIYVLEAWIPGINLSRLGLGEIGILIFLAWFAIFTSFALIPVYLMILTFFIVSLLFGKRVASYV